jgi:hypothetical protein
MTATPKQIEASFTEWERQYRESPEAFMTAQERASQSAETYGEACAPFFIQILSKIQSEESP